MSAMDDADLQRHVARWLQDAITFDEQELAPARKLATEYYHGKPFGNETDGRSKVVLTTLRDTVQSLLPSLMRVFFGPEHVVEFRPRGPEDEAVAQQQTDYINYLVREENAGFTELYSVLKDAMIRRLGVIKWWWEDTPVTESGRYSGLTREVLLDLAAGKEGEEVEVRDISEEGVSEDGQPLYGAEISRTTHDGKVRFAALPPEEFVYNRSARSLDDAILVAHVSEKPKHELRAMGIPEDKLIRVAQSTRNDPTGEIATRQPGAVTFGSDPAEEGDYAPILYCEAYVHLDMAGTGTTELRKVCTVGTGYDVVFNQPAPERPFACFIPDPEPHTLLGLGISDQTMDLQLIGSSVFRGTLDSLSLSLHPRTEVVEGQVNMKDVLNTEIGAIIRARAPGMVREVRHSFVGADALPVMGFLEEIKEHRTGLSRASMGLNPDALQSSTQAAVAATVTASQQRLELLARCFAETGFTQLYRGLYRLVARHQNRPKTVRLYNQYVEVDPRTWSTECDVQVNVALGNGLTEEKVGMLAQIAQKQEALLQQLGPNNPMVSLGQYGYTLSKMVELLGFKDSSRFFTALPPNFQMPQPEPAPDPAMILAQIESTKVQAQADLAQAELAWKRESDLRKDDRERDKNESELRLKEKEIEFKYRTEINDAELRHIIEKERLEVQRNAKPAPQVALSMSPGKRKIRLVRDAEGRIGSAEVEEVMPGISEMGGDMGGLGPEMIPPMPGMDLEPEALAGGGVPA